MKKELLALALGVAGACSSFAYGPTGGGIFVEVGYPRMQFSLTPDGKKSDGVGVSTPVLSGAWTPYSVSFYPERDGIVCLRFGPCFKECAPAFYKDVKLNGQEIAESDWKFYESNGECSRKGFLTKVDGKPLMTVFFSAGAYCFSRVKGGERNEFSMLCKSGSVVDFYKSRLLSVESCVADAMKTGLPLEGRSLVKAKELAESLNGFSELGAKELGFSVKPLPLDSLTLDSLKAKAAELASACDARIAATADDPKPDMADKPDLRKAFSGKLDQTALLANQLRSACLLDFMTR